MFFAVFKKVKLNKFLKNIKILWTEKKVVKIIFEYKTLNIFLSSFFKFYKY